MKRSHRFKNYMINVVSLYLAKSLICNFNLKCIKQQGKLSLVAIIIETEWTWTSSNKLFMSPRVPLGKLINRTGLNFDNMEIINEIPFELF